MMVITWSYYHEAQKTYHILYFQKTGTQKDFKYFPQNHHEGPWNEKDVHKSSWSGSPLKVLDTIQKSFIQVDERGTEVLLNHENRVLEQKYFAADHSLLCEILRREFCSSKGGFCQLLEPTWFRRKERSKKAGPRKCWRVRFVRVCCVQSQLDSNDPNRLPSKDSYNRLSTEFFIDLSMKTIHPPKVPKTLRSKHIQLMM